MALHSLTMLVTLSCSCALLQAGKRKPEHSPGGGAALCHHAAQAGAGDRLGLRCHVSFTVLFHYSNYILLILIQGIYVKEKDDHVIINKVVY